MMDCVVMKSKHLQNSVCEVLLVLIGNTYPKKIWLAYDKMGASPILL